MQTKLGAKHARGTRGHTARMRALVTGTGVRMRRRILHEAEIAGLLDKEDVKVLAGSRGDLARNLARRKGISVGEAKRQVRDLERVVRRIEGGTPSRGKRIRRTFERTGGELRETLARGVEGLREHLGRVLTTGGLAGKSGTKLPRPRKKKQLDDPAAPAAVPAAHPDPDPSSPEAEVPAGMLDAPAAVDAGGVAEVETTPVPKAVEPAPAPKSVEPAPAEEAEAS